jgi:hypothetical protein
MDTAAEIARLRAELDDLKARIAGRLDEIAAALERIEGLSGGV